MKKSKEVKTIMYFADVEADMNNDRYIRPEYIAIALLTQEINVASMILLNHGIDIDKIYGELLNLYSNNTKIFGSKLNKVPSKEGRDVLLKTEMIALTNKAEELMAEHLLLGLLSCTNETQVIFNKNRVTYTLVVEALINEGKEGIIERYNKNNSNMFMDFNNEDMNHGLVEPKVGVRKVSKTPFLDEFGENISEMAENGKLQNVFGRDSEINRITQILCRKTKRNPIIVGEAGVGKSAIIEGLALQIKEKKAPKALLDKKIIGIDVVNLVSGTKYRGQFEQRMKGIIQELKNNPEIILFIDEIHTLVGAGGATGSLDAANVLKPALARGEIQLIGSTTFNEYKDTIEKDGALNRRLQKIVVEEPSVEDSKVILKNIRPYFEDFHNVIYSDEIIDACVDLSNRYIQDRFMPDKAIDLMDEAGSLAKISASSDDKEIIKLEEKIDNILNVVLKDLDGKKKIAIKNSQFEEASKIRDMEKKKLAQLNKLRSEIQEKSSDKKILVNIDTINSVLSTMSNIPVDKISLNEKDKILNIGDSFKTRVIGQENAIDRVSQIIIRNKSGIKDPSKPSVLMFLGPTGVGKTLLAKEIAETVYGGKNSLIRIDMSEFSEKFSVNNLIGAPQGYAGYGEGGKLTEAVRRKPYSVVLLDEIEKAHPEMFNIFLQILDEGRITDGNGRLIDFKNTMIIMTSNVGVKELNSAPKSLGFATSPTENKNKEEEIIKKALKKKFAPEFLNRIGETIIFNKLTFDNIKGIVGIELKKLNERVNSLGFKLNVKEDVVDYLAKTGFDPEYGARPLHRAIESKLMNLIGEAILREDKGKTLTLIISNDEIKIK